MGEKIRHVKLFFTHWIGQRRSDRFFERQRQLLTAVQHKASTPQNKCSLKEKFKFGRTTYYFVTPVLTHSKFLKYNRRSHIKTGTIDRGATC